MKSPSSANLATLRPFFSYFGGKWTIAPHYPPPAHAMIVEPFAGSAGYATRYPDREVVLVEREPRLAAMWRWLVGVSVDEVMALPLDPSKREGLAPGAQSLIGFWSGRGRTSPASTVTSGWLTSGKWPRSFWGPYARARIAQQVTQIRHWRIIEGDYTDAPESRTTPTLARGAAPVVVSPSCASKRARRGSPSRTFGRRRALRVDRSTRPSGQLAFAPKRGPSEQLHRTPNLECAMSGHHCHALGCKNACPPRWLMCRGCWARVPADLQAEVYRTVKLRGPSVDATWAPWWRAQARAIAHVAMLVAPNEAQRDRYLAHAMATADKMEARGT